jgi:hypothetical protein
MLLSANNYSIFGVQDDDQQQQPTIRDSFSRVLFLRFSKTLRLHKKLKRASEGNASVAGLNQGSVGGSRRYSSV